ncbi:hypothetical protein [Marinobacter mangrovi]|uniref:hypothetical protein n=1 Tax=Marinobacter mangrovi TaxID=2803918 RepID=UPI001931C3F7|nr:hypothetical protein [Marinobacter mangrovi]
MLWRLKTLKYTEGTVATAPFKSRARATQKILNEYDGDSYKIKDLARNTIIAPEDRIDSVVSELASRGANIKRIDGTSNPLGHSGVNTTVNTRAGIVAEVQVNTPDMIYAKEPESIARSMMGDDLYNTTAARHSVKGGQGHKLYEEWRELENPDSDEAKKIADRSKKYYMTIRNGNANQQR